jgi:hypothetical protein
LAFIGGVCDTVLSEQSQFGFEGIWLALGFRGEEILRVSELFDQLWYSG